MGGGKGARWSRSERTGLVLHTFGEQGDRVSTPSRPPRGQCTSGGGLLATSPKRHLPLQATIHRHGVLRSRQLRRTFAERAQPRVDARGIAKRSGRRKNLFPELVLSRPREKPFAGAFPWQQSAVRTRAAQSE